MARFDFIIGKDFQGMLERDYAELVKSRDGEAWKSVHVLAGSIIEALLIDYLVSTAATTTNANRPKKDPLKMDLAEAVEVCKEEGALSDRTAQLCSVVRSYRNLIHPGRMVRLAEDTPSEDTARIAMSLVDIIIRDVAKMRQRELGLTADQVLSKLERDPQSLSILRHLFQEMAQPEQDRLVLDVLPGRILERDAELAAQDDEFAADFDSRTPRLVRAYGVIHDLASEETRKKAMQKYIKVLREGDGELVTRYDNSFFSSRDLRFLTEPQQRMAIEHFLAKMRPTATSDSTQHFGGIEQYMTPSEAQAWLDIIIRTVTSERVPDPQKEAVEEYFGKAVSWTSDDADRAMQTRLKIWEKHFQEKNDDDGKRTIARLEEALMMADLPF